jgi:cobalt/nickel transport system permease protein
MAVLLTIAAISSEPLGILPPYAGYTLLMLLVARVWRASFLRACRRSLALMPLLILLGAGLPLSRGLDVWLASEASLRTATALEFLATPAPWMDGASLLLRALCALLLLNLLVQAASWHGVLAALRSLGLPVAIPMVLEQLERYRTLLAGEWRRTSFAREARSPGGMRFAFSSYAGQTGLVFLRSWERSERIHAAMLARGFSLDAPQPAASRYPRLPASAFLQPMWLPALAILIRLAL